MAESEHGPGNWLTTYADFITLLMTFFVLMYSMTSGVDQNKFEAVVGVFQSDNGILKHHSMIDHKIPPLKRDRRKNWKELNKAIKAHDLENQIQFKMVPNGITITLGGPLMFKTYSAKLKQKGVKILKRIAYSLQKDSYEPLKKVKVFGNTDSRPVAENAIKFPSNWALGARRAISVVKFLIKHSSVSPEKFVAVTLGKYHPIASNATREGRQRNRRVKIYVEYGQKVKNSNR